MPSKFASVEKPQNPSLEVEYKSYLIRIPILIVVCSVLVTLFTAADQGSIYNRYLVVLAVLVPAIFLGGFVIGLFVALIPYKNLPYSRKYFRASLRAIFWILAGLIIAATVVSILLMINNS